MISNPPTGASNLPNIHWTDLLLGHPELVAQYILEISDGQWECRCGNTHDHEGFEPCDEFGVEVAAELGPWDGALYVCTKCWRVISGDTLEILRVARPAVIDLNTEYRWSYLSNKSTNE